MKDTYTTIRETRFKEGLGCVHCESVKVKRNGKYRDRQRNLCRDCGKSFNDLSNTPISGTRYLGKRARYFQMMVEGYTLPKIAKRLKIHISTAFYWRHKILFALRSMGYQMLKGIIESDETFFKESLKGRRKLDRKPKKRGGRDKGWMDRFQGVATNHLDNYLYWFSFLQQGKKLAEKEQINQMLLSACQNSNIVTVDFLRSV